MRKHTVSKLFKNWIVKLNKEYFKSEILNAFHTDFQSFKKGNKYVEQFKIIQLYGC